MRRALVRFRDASTGRPSGGGVGFGRGILRGQVVAANPPAFQLHDRGYALRPTRLEHAPLSDRRGEIARKRDGDPGAVRL